MLRMKWGQASRSLHETEGSSVVEFALVGSLFMLLTGLVIQGAILFSAWLTLTNAIHEAARLGSPCYGRSVQGCSSTDIARYACLAAQPIDESKLTISVEPEDNAVTVSASYPVPVVAPFVASVVPSPMTISAQTAFPSGGDDGSSSVTCSQLS